MLHLLVELLAARLLLGAVARPRAGHRAALGLEEAQTSAHRSRSSHVVDVEEEAHSAAHRPGSQERSQETQNFSIMDGKIDMNRCDMR